MSLRRAAAALAILLLAAGLGEGAVRPFVPEAPTLSTASLKPGERGVLKTVLKGTQPTDIPVEVVSVIPQKGEVENVVLIRFLPNADERAGRLAQGMSGSPVYVRGKLIGAVGSGWEFGDHRLALVTPIDVMCAIFAHGEKAVASGAAPEGRARLAAPLSVSGLSQRSARRLGRALGATLSETPGSSGGRLKVAEGDFRFKPGDSIAAMLAWGDVDVAATGAVTAVSRDGRFIAFGHPFLKRGRAAYPAARAYVHEVVLNQAFPFKLASPLDVVGTVTQDRAAGIGGRAGQFPASISATLVLKDRDRGHRIERSFRVVSDAFLSAKLLESIYAGLLEDLWGRVGQGTMSVTLRIEGKGVRNGWTRSDVFVSDEDVGGVALKQSAQIMDAFLLQPFEAVMPLAFRLEVEATEEPRVLVIEGVDAPSEARPGADLPVTVTLRPWRGRPVKRSFKLKVPEDASGVCELLVRGGGAQPLPQLSLEGGWKSIDSLNRMLEEIAAFDANDELVVELLSDSMATALKKVGKGKDAGEINRGGGKKDPREKPQGRGDGEKEGVPPELLPEETEYLSETKERRIREGSLRVLRSDRFVDGLMRRLVTVTDDSDEDSDGSDAGKARF